MFVLVIVLVFGLGFDVVSFCFVCLVLCITWVWGYSDLGLAVRWFCFGLGVGLSCWMVLVLYCCLLRLCWLRLVVLMVVDYGFAVISGWYAAWVSGRLLFCWVIVVLFLVYCYA